MSLAAYERDGFRLLPAACPEVLLAQFEEGFLHFAEAVSGQRFKSMQAMAGTLVEDPDLESSLYDGVRKTSLLEDFSTAPALTRLVENYAGKPVGLLSKIILRIDLPGVDRERSPPHQDFWYVKGNEKIITAWIPLQDTTKKLGAIRVMPGSHKLGPIDHDVTVGKRQYPSDYKDACTVDVEMKRGDVLLFHSCLLHESGFNRSEQIRFSIQARYSPLSLPTHPDMGRLIPVGDADAIA